MLGADYDGRDLFAAVPVPHLPGSAVAWSSVFVTPVKQCNEHRKQVQACRREPVLASGPFARILILGGFHQPCCLQFAKPPRDNGFTDPSVLLYFIEAMYAVEQLADYQQRPLRSNNFEGGLDRTILGTYI